MEEGFYLLDFCKVAVLELASSEETNLTFRGVRRGGAGAAAPPQFFEIFTYFPWNFTQKYEKSDIFQCSASPVFALPPHLLKRVKHTIIEGAWAP